MQGPVSPGEIRYELKLAETTASSGYFAVVPAEDMDFQQGLSYLREHPYDDFMRKHLIAEIQSWPREKIQNFLNSQEDIFFLALLCEACLLTADFNDLPAAFSRRQKKEFLPQTSLIYIKSHMLKDHLLHAGWADYFHANIYRHRPLPPPDKSGLQMILSHSLSESIPPEGTLKYFHERLDRTNSRATSLYSAGKTAEIALDRLSSLNILAGEEMRHEASLSPYALLRKWQMDRSVKNRGLNYRLSGIQTAYGKGIDLASARASCAMEIVERYSAYVRIENNQIVGTKRSHALIYGSRSELIKEGYQVIDVDSLGLEVPYGDASLHWIEASPGGQANQETVLVPAQSLFLFCNLDEISLYSGLGSTGLAAGNTLAEAKLSAVLEIIERDCEAVYPYHPSRCFRVVADDPKINALFEDYLQRGIQIQFQDISPPFGVPCCKCFVVHRDGTIAKGTSAHLDGRKAVLSALTETPYPYPYGPPSMPQTMDLPVLKFEELPVFSSNDAETDLQLLENTLYANKLYPHYVELTRLDIDLPVVKALIPGLEIMNDFDSFGRISPRLFSNYLKIYNL